MSQAAPQSPRDPMEYIKKWIPVAQAAFVCFLIFAIVTILIHNVFAPPEKDIPKEAVINLLRLFPAALAQTDEWPNETNQSMTL